MTDYDPLDADAIIGDYERDAEKHKREMQRLRDKCDLYQSDRKNLKLALARAEAENEALKAQIERLNNQFVKSTKPCRFTTWHKPLGVVCH